MTPEQELELIQIQARARARGESAPPPSTAGGREIRQRGRGMRNRPEPPEITFEDSQAAFNQMTDPTVRRQATRDFLEPLSDSILQPINSGLTQMFGLRDVLSTPEAGNLTYPLPQPRSIMDPTPQRGEGLIDRGLETVGQGLGVATMMVAPQLASLRGAPAATATARAAANPALYPTPATGGMQPAIGTAVRAQQAPGVAPHIAARGTVQGAPSAATYQNPLMAGIADSARYTAGAPLATLGQEIAGGFGAGAGMETARLSGAGPLTETMAGLVGGPAAIFAPGLGLRASQNIAGRAIAAAEDFSPLPQSALDSVSGRRAAYLPGGRRAGERLQALATDPEQAAGRAVAADPNLTPARATDDAALQALERRILHDDPAAARRVETGLEDFRTAQGDELQTMFGAGRPRGEWQQSVMQRVAAPGADPIPAGATDEMLDAVTRSYESAYEVAKGYPIMLTRLGDVADADRPLQALLRDASRTRSTRAGSITPAEREQIAADLGGRFDDLSRELGRRGMPDGTVDSAALLEFRSGLRADARAYRREARNNGSAGAAARAEIHEAAEKKITQLLESQLPEDVIPTLNAIDRNYGEFKIVEDAVYRGGDRELRPESLQQSIKTAAPSKGALARGEAERAAAPNVGPATERQPLTVMARGGVDVSKVAGDPAAAERLVRGMDPAQAQQTKAEFNNFLFNRNLTPARERDAAQFVSGKRLTESLAKNRETMLAMGYTPDELGRLDRIAANLRLVETKDREKLTSILTDEPSRIMRFVAAAAGSSVGRGIAAKLGGGMTHSLIIAHTGARIGREVVENAVRDNAEQLLRKAVDDPELYAALLTRSTDPLPRRQAAGRALWAWLSTTLGPEIEAANGVPTEGQ